MPKKSASQRVQPRSGKTPVNEDAVLEALQKASEPLSLAAIAKQAGAARDEQKNLSAALAALEEKGMVVRNRRDAYGLPERMGLVQGVVRGHRSGGGTLLTESGQEWFLPPGKCAGYSTGTRCWSMCSRPVGGAVRRRAS